MKLRKVALLASLVVSAPTLANQLLMIKLKKRVYSLSFFKMK